MKKLIVLIILFSSNAYAEKDIFGIDVSNHSLAIAAGLGISADWWTTATTLQECRYCSETNRRLTEHPSRRRINTFFISKLFIHTTINYLGSKVDFIGKTKNIWNGFETYISIDAARSNYLILMEYRSRN